MQCWHCVHYTGFVSDDQVTVAKQVDQQAARATHCLQVAHCTSATLPADAAHTLCLASEEPSSSGDMTAGDCALTAFFPLLDAGVDAPDFACIPYHRQVDPGIPPEPWLHTYV